MSTTREKRSSNWDFSPDMAFLFFLFGAIFLILFTMVGISVKRNPWDSFLFRPALALGGAGAILLFCARLPLYRQRRFFTIGPKELHGVYRKLYLAAYTCIVPSVILLSLMLC
jgi:multisubunit Na+/H+ antiporter MnhB subunit